MVRYWCRRCGIVRDLDEGSAPFCRHGDAGLPAARMVPIPRYHPCADDGQLYADHREAA